MHMKAETTFTLVKGGLDASSRATPGELTRELIGVARFKTVAEEPDIVSYLMSVNPHFKFLIGQTVGVFQEGIVAPSHQERQPCKLIRVPSLDEKSNVARWIPDAWFGFYIPYEATGPFDNEERRRSELLRKCFLSDRIYLIGVARANLPVEPTQGINREQILAWQQAAMDWLTSGVATNDCEICHNQIERFAYNDSESAFVGPIRQRCHNCVSK